MNKTWDRCTMLRRRLAWLLVSVFVMLAAIPMTAAAGAEGGSVTVTGSVVNVRKGAGTSYAAVTTVKKGECYDCLGSETAANGTVWYRVRIKDILSGYICGTYAEYTQGSKPTVLDTEWESIVYGTSGSGKYSLTAYRLGTGKNVMLLTFAIHGWEDNYSRDGNELVYTAQCLMAYLSEHTEYVTEGDWSVYVIPCCNPDGLYLGTTCNGKGRCTAVYIDDGENQRTDKGVDMNRSFNYRFVPFTEARYFNGTAPLRCVESRALAEFARSICGTGKNVVIDAHGWMDQTITSVQGGKIYNAFRTRFTGTRAASLADAHGYFTSWCAYVLRYEGCLFEFPSDVTSASVFRAKGYSSKFIGAVTSLLRSY